MGTPPLPQSKIVHMTGVLVGDALGIANHQGADPMVDGEGDNLLGCLMLSLVDAAAVANLEAALSQPVAAPAARATLPGLGCSPCGLSLAGLPVAEMQVALGPQSPP
jgi:hypothetical protein